MRIVTIKTMYVSAGKNERGHYFVPELYVEKMVFTSYTDALNARVLLKKHFGKMEIKRLKGGYGLYTRCASSTKYSSRYFRGRLRRCKETTTIDGGKKGSRTINRALCGGRTNSPIGVRFGGRGQH